MAKRWIGKRDEKSEAPTTPIKMYIPAVLYQSGIAIAMTLLFVDKVQIRIV
jgi:hypothetical protein